MRTIICVVHWRVHSALKNVSVFPNQLLWAFIYIRYFVFCVCVYLISKIFILIFAFSLFEFYSWIARTHTRTHTATTIRMTDLNFRVFTSIKAWMQLFNDNTIIFVLTVTINWPSYVATTVYLYTVYIFYDHRSCTFTPHIHKFIPNRDDEEKKKKT